MQVHNIIYRHIIQRWSREHKARDQGQGQEHKKNPRPRTALPRIDTLEAKDTNARGQGQGPRTQTQVFSKKKAFKKTFSGVLHKLRSKKFFSADLQNFKHSENSAVFEPRTWGFEANAKDSTFEAKTKDFKMCLRGRPRGQARPRGHHLCYHISKF